MNWILKVANLPIGTFNAQKFNIGSGGGLARPSLDNFFKSP
jgi:hypothetical protein